MKTLDTPGGTDLPAAPARTRRRRRRRVLRWVAIYLVLMGAALLGQVGYQQYGTGIQTAHAQAAILAEVEKHGLPEKPIPGGAIGFIQIPRLGVDMAFVQGTDLLTLRKGPGHYPQTPLPGRGGNVAIAGHRTTHGAPFWAVNALKPGDQIILRTRKGRFVYEVRWVKIVEPDAWWVVAPTKKPSLTLTSCYPKFSSRQRLVVRALQVDGPGRRVAETPVR